MGNYDEPAVASKKSIRISGVAVNAPVIRPRMPRTTASRCVAVFATFSRVHRSDRIYVLPMAVGCTKDGIGLVLKGLGREKLVSGMTAAPRAAGE
jgi:hypothetical protein